MPQKSYRRQYPQLYKRYPRKENTVNQAELSLRGWRIAGEIAGFTPEEAEEYSLIVKGESGGRPGVLGHDPNGYSTGVGGPQNTPEVWGDAAKQYLAKLGGEKALTNPVKASKMAYFLYKSAGKTWSPWYGTRYLHDVKDAKSLLGTGGTSGPQSRQNGRKTSTSIPGVDNTALRQQLLQQYLAQDYDPNALLGLAQGLEGAQDIPGVTIPGQPRGRERARGRDVVTATGQSVNKMLSKAVKWDKSKVPYLWGGGHGVIAKPGQPVDCSGFVSAVLGLDTPQVSGNLTQWGKPGRGKWITVYANDGHTFMSIRDPKTRKTRWFGTSRSNPGGGAGEMPPPSSSYLAGFAVRHPG